MRDLAYAEDADLPVLSAQIGLLVEKQNAFVCRPQDPRNL